MWGQTATRSLTLQAKTPLACPRHIQARHIDHWAAVSRDEQDVSVITVIAAALLNLAFALIIKYLEISQGPGWIIDSQAVYDTLHQCSYSCNGQLNEGAWFNTHLRLAQINNQQSDRIRLCNIGHLQSPSKIITAAGRCCSKKIVWVGRNLNTYSQDSDFLTSSVFWSGSTLIKKLSENGLEQNCYKYLTMPRKTCIISLDSY